MKTERNFKTAFLSFFSMYIYLNTEPSGTDQYTYHTEKLFQLENFLLQLFINIIKNLIFGRIHSYLAELQ